MYLQFNYRSISLNWQIITNQFHVYIECKHFKLIGDYTVDYTLF